MGLRYEVIVGTIGTVLETDARKAAVQTYMYYRVLSCENVGRVGGESVTLLDSGNILC